MKLIFIVGSILLGLLGMQSYRLSLKNTEIEKLKLAIVESNLIAEQQSKELEIKITEAHNEAIKRQKTLKAAADNARAVADSLRKQLENKTQTADNAASQSTDAVSTILADCARDYADMAEKADGHASDVKTLMDAWPK
jgi:ABC-type transporter Mla subunit MlaD